MQATVSVLALYFALLHLEIHLVTIVETTSNSDDVNERYRVVVPKSHPNPLHVYAELVDEGVDVNSSGGGQGTTTLSAGLENDAASTLSELTELSESKDGEDSEEESEEEVPLAEIHRLGNKNSLRASSPRTQPTSPGSSDPYTTFQTLDGVDVYSQKVRGTKDAMYNVFESIGDVEIVMPPILPKYLVIPFDLYIHRWSGGVQAWIFSADGWSELRAGDAHPVFSDRRFFIRRSEPPRWLKLNTYSRVERSAMRFAGMRYRQTLA